MNAEQLKGIGEQIVSARERKGWSQVDLAREAGFTDNTVRKIERGERVAPGTLRKVLDTVGIQPVADQLQAKGYPRDVQALLDVMAMYLVALPEAERPAVLFEVSQLLLNRRDPGRKD